MLMPSLRLLAIGNVSIAVCVCYNLTIDRRAPVTRPVLQELAEIEKFVLAYCHTYTVTVYYIAAKSTVGLQRFTDGG